jgi:beta-mannosidase
MDAPVRHRHLLQAGWRLCSAPPGSGDAAPADAARWLPIDAPAPVAAALRQRGEWSLDAAPTDFDAGDWWYRVRFDRPATARGATTVLGFDGLATLAEVRLNGKPLLASDNMFVQHEHVVTDLLGDRDNELTIRFRSVATELAQRRPRPRWRAPMVAHQQLRWLRTSLLGRTPGWSPPAAVVGPWRPVWLEQRGPLHPVDTQLDAFMAGDEGIVRCHVELPYARQHGIERVTLELERSGVVQSQPLAPAAGAFRGELRVARPQLWWPHTHGEPALYAARLRVRGTDGEALHELGRVGFRTIELDAAGGDFRVKVNGVPVLCRGAGWTPLDPVSLRSTPEQCRAALLQARAAGMNMLRVAGTLAYEEDHFYEWCDELGLLVWQDFMFANMDYPEQDQAFVASVTLEATQQLRRLHARPCLAVWCGNSEVEQQAAMWGAPRETWSAPLFDHLLAELCAAHAPRTPYWPSSAHGGAFPHQADVGTTSYYGVGAYLRPPDDARRAGLRFATECLAFANIPQPAALERLPGGLATRAHHAGWKTRSPRDLGAGWDFDDVRDHYVRVLFGVDANQLRATEHERYLLLGRLATAEVMAAAFSDWRRPGSTCRGALVLFLRDLWAGAGWGVIDEQGAPKACYHALKRVLQPLAVLLTDEGGNGLYLHIINERDEARALQLELSAWRDGDVRIAHAQRSLEAAPRSALTLPAMELLPGFMDLTYAYRFGPLPCDAVVVTLRDERGAMLAEAFHFPGGLDARPRGDAALHAHAGLRDDGVAEVVVRAGRLAQGVHFEIPGFEPDDEYFHLAPGAERHVLLRPTGDRPLAGWVHASNSTHGAAVEVEAAASAMKGRST